MALLLNIDTATETASVCITDNGLKLALAKSNDQKKHASFVHTAIASMLKETGYILSDMDAFAVTSGPGSYTGLRVGMAAAKGFCYALSKPLITVNTLEVMAKAAIDKSTNLDKKMLFCPMIDARRLEVFTAIYNAELECMLPPQPLILHKGVLDSYMISEKIMFFGSGSTKFKELQSNANAIFAGVSFDAYDLAQLAEKDFYKGNFADISLSVPTYFKDFQSITIN